METDLLESPLRTLPSTKTEMAGVRLVDGDGHCSGMPQVLYEGNWSIVDSVLFDYRNAMVVCRELNCGNAVNVTFRENVRKEDINDTFLSITCEGKESAFSQCKQRDQDPLDRINNIIHSTDAICSDSVRLVDGAGLCSGRLEVKSHQSWTSVCETGFDQQDAEVVCRELGCGTPLTLQGALFGEGKHPFGTKDFQCKGTENRLLTCSTSEREEHTCALGKAVGLTCSEPDDVKLVGGSSRCAGTVKVFHTGEWRSVTAVQWSIKEAAVVCRQLDCGSAVVASRRSSSGPSPWSVQIECEGSESALRECRSYYNQHDWYRAEVICSDSVRLVDGAGLCSGRVEVKPHQSWTSVCETGFDQQDAEVVCRELGCGSPLTLQGALFGEGKHPFGTKEFQCRGTEDHLLKCSTSEREEHTCALGKAVGLTCSDSVRLVDGDGLCSGRLEVKTHQSWTSVCETGFDQQDAEVVCRELGCGTPLTLQGALFGEGKHPFGTKDFQCNGTENRLLNCSTSDREEQNCTRGKAVGLTCQYVKLVDGSSRCAGTVMLYDKKWRTVEGNAWSMKDAAVVCRQLDCGSAVAVTSQYLEMATYEDNVQIFCSGSESGLKECAFYDVPWSLSSAGVICSGQQEATTAAVQKEK
uniref:SRCR domain-containing protein n=1 Tax=Pygocentrus nattereri TaxID=42514 RepID=A0A3B4BQH6_PYGNA